MPFDTYWLLPAVFPISAKKCKIFSGIFAKSGIFIFCQKSAFLFLAKHHEQLQLRFSALSSSMLHEACRKLADLKSMTFLFFGNCHKVWEKDAFVSAMTFSFARRKWKFWQKIFAPLIENAFKSCGIFALNSKLSQYFWHLPRRWKVGGNTGYL